ncbi:MAG: NAD(P)H-dependent glycerol-3-phosphate dehydrogenase [Candidatus Omnitrophota bacterium]
MKRPNISVLGDGGWGTTLAILLFRKGFDVTIWGAFPDYISYMDKNRQNPRFLAGVPIPKKITLTADLRQAISGKKVIVLAIPSQYLRRVLKKMKPIACCREAVFVSVIKGIEMGTLKRMSQVIYEELGRVRLAVLSGPTIACEVAKGLPTVAVIASRDKRLKKFLQNVFMTERFRVYTNEDMIGVELGGSLKNIIAIACGISDGLGFGTNTLAALLSRGLAEISRLGHAMGAHVETFSGISGLGDLVTTCVSPYSRNRFVGVQIGRGRTLRNIQGKMCMVAEGIPTTKSAYYLGLKNKVDLPITKEVYNVLYRRKPPLEAFTDLMARKKKGE